MPDPKWSDDHFLDLLRQQGDELADETVRRLIEEHGTGQIRTVFEQMRVSDRQLPADAPAPIREFIARTSDLPANVDQERLRRSDAVSGYGPPACLVLLASSLPRGYAAPCLCRILAISNDLGTHPYKRLMGVVQLLVDLGGRNAFSPGGRAVVAAQKMRLLHAGVRHVAARYRPDYASQFGPPVNHEDMLATIMGFSYLVIEGLKRMGLHMSEAEAEDRYYRWRVFARLMGIHPPGRPDDDSWIPATYEDAAQFYASFVRRHDTGPDRNPEGVLLARANLDMMTDLIPRWLRRLGFGAVPRIAMTELLSEEELARVGLKPITGHEIVKGVLTVGLHVLFGLRRWVAPNFLWLASQVILHEMVRESHGGDFEFTIPTTLADLRSSAFE